MTKKVTVVCDLQYGSTGKGLITGYLAEREKFDTVITTWMPNAGHTFIDAEGRKYVHTMLANGVVSPNLRRVMIGPGSMINVDSLSKEIADVESGNGLNQFRLMIHPHAGVVTKHHRDIESGPMTKIGSTKKGCGAALIHRIQRDPHNNNVAVNALIGTEFEDCLVTIDQWNLALIEADNIMLEMAQGFSLSIYHGFYPYTTSRDVTPAQGMADAGLPLSWLKKVVGCLRTFPIRVANRYDESGKQVGWSGPCYPDQEELDWSYVGVEPELTTVTKLPRRIFSFSIQQLREACFICEPDELFLNFANYLNLSDQICLIRDINEAIGIGTKVRYIGHGPQSNHVSDLTEREGNLENCLINGMKRAGINNWI